MSGEGAHPDHISILRKDGRSFLPPGYWDEPDAFPQNYSAAGSAGRRQPSAAWTLQTPALRSRGWGCPHLLLALRSVGAVSCPGQMGFPSCNDAPSFVVLWGDVIARQPTGQVPPECSRVSPIYSDTGGPRHCCWSHADARLSLYTVGP